jgi:hypothetical protein
MPELLLYVCVLLLYALAMKAFFSHLKNSDNEKILYMALALASVLLVLLLLMP